MMRDYFYAVAAVLDQCIAGKEHYQCWFSGEATDFVRFNRSAIRQAGHVRQVLLSLDWIDDQRHAATVLTLAGDLLHDRPQIEQAVAALRAQLPDLPPDPHLLQPDVAVSSEHVADTPLLPTQEMVDQILSHAGSVDLVGILAAGPVYRGFAGAHGQRNWHASTRFNFDWSLYQSRDKAVKSSYAGTHWDPTELARRCGAALEQLALLQRTPISVAAGSYRAYLAPAALHELVGMLNWDGLSEKSLRTRQSALRRMRDEGLALHPAIRLREHTAGGIAPDFQEEGFARPPTLTLIDQGRLVGSMISPRTACEYGLATNGANAEETMQSLDMDGGALPMAEALSQLGTGIYISNLWYLNFSDRANCRITGMTRFATFWVENGQIQAPLNVMRFDDSLYQLLGENLLALTRERELLVSNDTYLERSTTSARLPGALVKAFKFVL